MNRISVSLRISPPDSMTLQEVTDLIGLPHSPTSWEKGMPVFLGPELEARGKVRTSTYWKSVEAEGNIDELEGALMGLMSQLRGIPKGRRLGKVDIDIAVFFDSPMCSICLSPDVVERISDLGIGVEVSIYPCSFCDEEDADR